MNRSIAPRAVASFVGAAALLGALATAAVAATATTTFQVTANVQALCALGAGNLDFGTYTGTVNDTTSTITVTCTNTTPYTVALSAGGGAGATTSDRKMTNGGSTLDYGLFRNAARTQNWGTTAGTDTVAGTGNGAAQQLTVFGRVDAGQFTTPGPYTDTITATITF